MTTVTLENTKKKHRSVTFPLFIKASSRQKLLPGAHPACSRGCTGNTVRPAGSASLDNPGTELRQRALLPQPAWGRSFIGGLRCIGQPENGAPSAGSAASANTGTELHPQARLVSEARRHLPPTSRRRMDSLRRIQHKWTSVVGGQSGGPTPRDKASLREAVTE